jgi:hypothetical protein
MEYDFGDLKDKVKGQFSLDKTKLYLTFPMTGGGVPIDYQYLTLFAQFPNNGPRNSIYIGRGTINPTLSNTIDISAIDGFNNFLTFMFQSFPVLPDSFFIQGQLIICPARLAPSGTFYDITDECKVNPVIDLTIPSFIGIKNGQMKEVNSFNGKDAITDDVTRAVVSAKLNFMFSNRIPMDLAVKLRFLGFNNNNQRDTLFYFDPSDIVHAATTQNGVAVEPPVISLISKSLNSNDFVSLQKSDSLFIQLDFITVNADSVSNPVELRKDDYIQIRGSLNAVYTVNRP